MLGHHGPPHLHGYGSSHPHCSHNPPHPQNSPHGNLSPMGHSSPHGFSSPQKYSPYASPHRYDISKPPPVPFQTPPNEHKNLKSQIYLDVYNYFEQITRIQQYFHECLTIGSSQFEFFVSQVNCTQHDMKLLKNSNRSLPSIKSPQSRATSPPRYQNRPFSPNAPYHGPHHHQHGPQQQEGGHQEDAHQGGQRPSPRLAASLPKLNTIQVKGAGRQIFKTNQILLLRHNVFVLANLD